MDQNTEQHTRPFDKDHAAAGAPYRLRNGREATVLKWDTRNPLYPLAGIYGSEDTSGNWTAAGQFDTRGPTDFDLVMVPLGFIDGKPVFVGDKVIDAFGVERIVRNHAADFTQCRWPEPPKHYPTTEMTRKDMSDVLAGPADYPKCVLVANAALRHAIDSGQLVIPTVAQAYEIGRQAATENFPPRFVAYKDSPEGIAAAKQAVRDMAVAEAVLDQCMRRGFDCIDLAAIIAKV